MSNATARSNIVKGSLTSTSRGRTTETEVVKSLFKYDREDKHDTGHGKDHDDHHGHHAHDDYHDYHYDLAWHKHHHSPWYAWHAFHFGHTHHALSFYWWHGYAWYADWRESYWYPSLRFCFGFAGYDYAPWHHRWRYYRSLWTPYVSYHIQPTYAEPAIEVVYVNPAPVIDRAWDDLSSGRYREAAGEFVRVVADRPGDGEPLIGLSIANAMMERDASAIELMREALRGDVDSMARVPVNDAIASHLRTMLDSFEDRAYSTGGDSDALFMVAVCRFLLADDAIAFFATQAALEHGDESASTANLHGYIHAVLTSELQ